VTFISIDKQKRREQSYMAINIYCDDLQANVCVCQNAVMLAKGRNNPKIVTKPLKFLSCLNCQSKGRTKFFLCITTSCHAKPKLTWIRTRTRSESESKKTALGTQANVCD